MGVQTHHTVMTCMKVLLNTFSCQVVLIDRCSSKSSEMTAFLGVMSLFTRRLSLLVITFKIMCEKLTVTLQPLFSAHANQHGQQPVCVSLPCGKLKPGCMCLYVNDCVSQWKCFSVKLCMCVLHLFIQRRLYCVPHFQHLMMSPRTFMIIRSWFSWEYSLVYAWSKVSVYFRLLNHCHQNNWHSSMA